MLRLTTVLAIGFGCSTFLAAQEEPDGLREQWLTRLRAELGQAPNYVCTQIVDRFTRPRSDSEWVKVDTLRLEVAFSGEKELYARSGARQFDARPLAELIGRGTTGTGQLAALARHVFLAQGVQINYKGKVEREGRQAYEYEYDVPAAQTGYRLRSGTAEAPTPFQGVFWIDAKSMDLIRLEMQAYDIPEFLGIAEANQTLGYTRVPVDELPALLPLHATLSIAATDGNESLNRSTLSGCRRFETQSKVRFDEASETETAAAAPPQKASPRAALSGGTILEVELERDLNLAGATIGDELQLKLARPIRNGERMIAPAGSTVLAQVVRLEKESIPFAMYEVGIELHTLRMANGDVPLNATMIEAGPEDGLIRQTKRLNPTFTRRRTNRMNILVREVQRGQGILHWDAKRGALPGGLKMKWRIQGDAAAEAERH